MHGTRFPSGRCFTRGGRLRSVLGEAGVRLGCELFSSVKVDGRGAAGALGRGGEQAHAYSRLGAVTSC